MKLKCEVGILNRLVDYVKIANGKRVSPSGRIYRNRPGEGDNPAHAGECISFHLSSTIEREWETTLRDTFEHGLHSSAYPMRSKSQVGDGGEITADNIVTATAAMSEREELIRRQLGNGTAGGVDGLTQAESVTVKVKNRGSEGEKEPMGRRQRRGSCLEASNCGAVMTETMAIENDDALPKKGRLSGLSKPPALHTRDSVGETEKALPDTTRASTMGTLVWKDTVR